MATAMKRKEFADMSLGEDDEGGGCSPQPPDKKVEPRYFKETLKTLEQLAKFLACVKCDKLPMQRVYTLGGCTHKYCEKCVTCSAGRACVICKVTSYPKDAKPDLFSTSVLSEIPAVYYAIAKMEERGSEMKNQERSSPEMPEKEENEQGGGSEEEEDTGINSCDLKSIPRPFSPPTENSLRLISGNDEDDGDDVDFEIRIRDDLKEQEDNDHEMEDEEIFAAELDEEVFENTPASRMIPHSSDPDVMEETPQNKTNTSTVALSFSKRRRSSKSKMHPKVLDLTLDSPKKGKKPPTKSTSNSFAGECNEMEASKTKTSDEKGTTDADEILFSEEELFRSQSGSREGVDELPVLTCHSPVVKVAPKEKEDRDAKGASKKSERKFFTSNRNPREQEPPTLTPHQKVNTYKPKKEVPKGIKLSTSIRDEPTVTIPITPRSSRSMKKQEEKTPSSTCHSPVVKVAPKEDRDAKGASKKSERKFFTSNRNPRKQEPPTLTPHQKVNTYKPKKEVPKGTKLSTSTRDEPPVTIPITPRSTKKQEEKTPSSRSMDKPKLESKSRAKKPKLNISMSTYSSDDDTAYEFEPSSKKRRISGASTIKNSNATVFSLKTAGGGVSKEKRNAKGETALHITCRVGQFDKVKKLVDEGADVNAEDHAGWTPLHEAVVGRAEIRLKENIIRFLCDKGCNVNAVGGTDDDTPLYTAAACGLESIVELLLELGASPNIRNSKGRLPVDDAFNEVIGKMLNERTSGGNTSTSIESSSAPSSSNYNSALTTVTVAEDDPAVIQVMLKKAVLYFNYKVGREVLEEVKSKLKLKVSEKLSTSVTHIVHQVKMAKGMTLIRVPFSIEYLFGLAHGMWQVGHDWIEKSIHGSQCLPPTAFEISGTTDDAKPAAHGFPGKARINKDKANPGLLDGFCFYLYKSCGYSSSKRHENSSLQLASRELRGLIQAAGGKFINREPDPSLVDPLDAPPRFHANQSNLSQSPFVLTSHIILYDDNGVPPKSKMYTMEHVKTLRSDWVIESISKFNLESPEKFL